MNKINIGSGWECREGWINADNTQKPQRENYPITYMDATVTWPYPDNHFDYVLSEHMIEHVPEEDGLNMLREAYRCMKPGAVIRITCPDRTFAESLMVRSLWEPGELLAGFHPFIEAYARKIFKRAPQAGDADRIGKRTLYEQGHVWVPTPMMLVGQIEKAGFRNVKLVPYGESEHEELNGIELMDGVREYESVCVEGIK